jgi:hypothetical protein
MPREESRKARERIKKQLQDSILNEYPNPERRGCPGDSVLKRLAAHPVEEAIEGDLNWHHVTHCSECYREFLGFRGEVKRGIKERRRKAAWVLVAAAVILIVIIVFFSSRVKSPKPQIIDLQGRSMPRSEEGQQETKPIVLEREPEELTIKLPFGSVAGPYEIQLLKTADHPLLSARGEATVRNGTTTLTTKADLSKLTPGNYFIGIRRVPWDWTYYRVLIR